MAFIWNISVVEFKHKSIINGIILNGVAPNRTIKTRAFNNFVYVINSYYKTPYSQGKLLLLSGKEKYEFTTSKKGGFNFEVDHKIDEDFEVFIKGQSQQLKINQTYPVFFKESESPLCIISDVDDTILVSHTANIWKRIKTLLFVSPIKRKYISFTQQLLNEVSDHQGRIFYVSKSEANLYGIFSSYIKNNELPTGYLMLTPYLIFRQLLSPKKGKDYKRNGIEMIIQNSPDKMFILMGDDTQQDISVYASIVKQYPGKIFKVYIRKTRKQLVKQKEKQLDALKNSGIPFYYFSDQDPVKQEIELIKKLSHEITFCS